MNVPKLRFKEFNDEWNLTNIRNISSLVTKGTTPKKYEDNGINFVKVENIHDNLISNISSYISGDTHNKELKRSILKENDILFSIAGALGRTAIVKKSILPANTNQANAIIRIENLDNIDLYYLLNRLNHTDITNYINKCQSVGAQPNLSLEQVNNINISLPSINEQNKIGNMLFLLDKKIELQSKKIEDLKLFKKGLNKIIYSDCCFIAKIKDIIEEYNERTQKNNQYKILSSTSTGIFFQDEYFNKQAASSNNIGYKIVPRGYITYRSMSDTGEFHFNIQNIIDNGIVSPAYPVFNIKNNIVDKNFLVDYLNENRNFKNKILSAKEGGTRYALSLSKLKELNISLPDYDQQVRYSKVLNICNLKIKLENNYLENLIKFKKILMKNMFV